MVKNYDDKIYERILRFIFPRRRVQHNTSNIYNMCITHNLGRSLRESVTGKRACMLTSVQPTGTTGAWHNLQPNFFLPTDIILCYYYYVYYYFLFIIACFVFTRLPNQKRKKTPRPPFVWRVTFNGPFLELIKPPDKF